MTKEDFLNRGFTIEEEDEHEITFKLISKDHSHYLDVIFDKQKKDFYAIIFDNADPIECDIIHINCTKKNINTVLEKYNSFLEFYKEWNK